MPGPDELLAALDPEQREVATALTGPVRVLAGAGTGKTRAITHRIAYGVLSGAYQPQRVLALTFTARAAGEMRTRLAGLQVPGVQARTFHSAALRQLQYFWPQVIGGTLPGLVEHKARLVGRAAARLRLPNDRAAVRDLSAEIEWSKVSMLTAESYPAAAARAGRSGAAGLDPAAVARLITAYEDLKGTSGLIDFEDVLLTTVAILRENGKIAAQVHEQYRHFVVDEYQDVSALQQCLLMEWLGRRDDLCVVGDPSQTIYSFAGADSRFLLEFGGRHPQARQIDLVRDYRSTPQVVHVANRILDAAAPAARRGRVDLVSQLPPGPEPQILPFGDDLAEAAGVTGRIRTLLEEGTPAAGIAVLYRTNAQSEAFEQTLSDAGIAYQVRGGDRFFAREEVRRGMLLLRGAARTDAGADVRAAARDALTTAGWSPRAPATSGARRDQWESLQALVTLTDEMVATHPQATLADVVAELEHRAAHQHAPSAGGVTLSSLHAAKGLEWEAVFVVGVSEGLLPISFADTPEAVEEERRLLYVGVTRARRRLTLSWSRLRSSGGRPRRASRFLDPLGGSRAAPPDTGPGTPRPRRRGTLHKTCRSCRAVLTSAAEKTSGLCAQCPPDHDEELFELLRAWRAAEAADRRVPAYVVFTDATLRAVSFVKPADLEELSTIAGIGATKRERFGEAVLDVVAGRWTGPPTAGQEPAPPPPAAHPD